jgi:hypothetical protein
MDMSRLNLLQSAATLCAAMLCATPAPAAESSRCMDAYTAEVTRIGVEAEMKAKANPVGRDIEAQQRFMQPVHDAMLAAANRARDCEEAEKRARGTGPAPAAPRKAAPAAPAANAEQTGEYAGCMARVDQRLDQLRRRTDANPNPDPTEQKVRREARQRVVDERAACLRMAR